MKKPVVLLVLLFTFTIGYAQQQLDISLRNEVTLSIQQALRFLEKTQLENGSWSQYPAITALATTAFLRSPFNYTEQNSSTVAKGIQFILKLQQSDGGIYADMMKTYNTAICLMALVATKNPAYDDAIRRARDFLISQQFDEEEGYKPQDEIYGGIGYNNHGGTDLSNLEWALQALKDSESYRKPSEASGKPMEHSGTTIASSSQMKGVSNRELFWQKALIFVQRCQNHKKFNDRQWAGNDGGFIYSPSESKAGDYTSYGSMSYAGLKSMIYAGLKKDDERVKAVVGWLQKNYTLEKNPQMGIQGLYYYYHGMSKALTAYGEDFITDSNNVKHNWRKEFAEKILSIQNGEGYWANQNNRWWENNKDLVTSYMALALEEVLK